jgi:hypothetical protein
MLFLQLLWSSLAFSLEKYAKLQLNFFIFLGFVTIKNGVGFVRL